ncbi:MAG: hypothetical protein C0190_06010 [Thermodesulfobacterium geofontis]|uniref:LysM domain-containing protein n=1 Tax=Thermodesulfobacterium geofontis TaxID=1295609 RepID=A0A2N7PMB6_9BACT|nr:MAG: hypothetical protein C0190_06010 [Thermodesulfobacterium geofontis]
MAKKYGISVEGLLRANPWIKNPDYIQVGWRIRISVMKKEFGIILGKVLIGLIHLL